MTDENTIADAAPIESAQAQEKPFVAAPEGTASMSHPKPQRTIFRFKGIKDRAIDLGKIYKVSFEENEKKVLLQISPKPEDPSDAVEFESVEAAYRGYEQIIGVWARGA